MENQEIDKQKAKRMEERRMLLKARLHNAAPQPTTTHVAVSTIELAKEEPYAMDKYLTVLDSIQNKSAKRMESFVARISIHQLEVHAADENIVKALESAINSLQSLHINHLLPSLETLKAIQDPRKLQIELEAMNRHAKSVQAVAIDAAQQAEEHIENQWIHFQEMLKDQTNSIDAAILAIDKECNDVRMTMRHAVEAIQKELLQTHENKKQLLRDDISTAFKQLEAVQITQKAERQARQANQQKDLEETRAREHAVYDKLCSSLARRCFDAAISLLVTKYNHVLSKDKLSYNLRVLNERRKENKTVLVQEGHMLHRLAATLSGLKGKHAHEKKQVDKQLRDMEKDTEKTREALRNLKEKMRHFAEADSGEVRKLVKMKEACIAEKVERLATAEVTIERLTGIALRTLIDTQIPLKDKVNQVTIDGISKTSDDRVVNDYIPAVRPDDMASPTVLQMLSFKKEEPSQPAFWSKKIQGLVEEEYIVELKKLEEAAKEDVLSMI